MDSPQDNELRQKIEVVIDDLAECYNHHKALILSEFDLHCQLYARLSQIPILAGNHPTANPEITGPRVHSALSWYDKNQKLAIVPDITILEVEHLSILHSLNGFRLEDLIAPLSQRLMPLPSKQYSLRGNAIIFEVKFCRNKNGITDCYFRKEIQKDFDKIKGLFTKLEKEGFPNSLFCYFVIFSKVNKRDALFQSFLEKHAYVRQNFKVIYKSGNIQMPTNIQRRFPPTWHSSSYQRKDS